MVGTKSKFRVSQSFRKAAMMENRDSNSSSPNRSSYNTLTPSDGPITLTPSRKCVACGLIGSQKGNELVQCCFCIKWYHRDCEETKIEMSFVPDEDGLYNEPYTCGKCKIRRAEKIQEQSQESQLQEKKELSRA